MIQRTLLFCVLGLMTLGNAQPRSTRAQDRWPSCPVDAGPNGMQQSQAGDHQVRQVSNEMFASNLAPYNYPYRDGPGTQYADVYDEPCYQFDGYASARGYYANDQRIEWTGQEETFGVEGVVGGSVRTMADCWEVTCATELYINQPFDRNILVDTQERTSFASNFDIDLLKISEMTISGRNGDIFLSIGKFVTPFGRAYFPMYTNDWSDGPFLRTDAILWRETGFLLQWDPGNWVFTAALTNGSEDRDTNSSKALIARCGYDAEQFAAGVSVKVQDGIGSESQKMYNNHIGGDFMFRHGRFTLSGECAYDEYGFHVPLLMPNDVFWGRGVYYREQNLALDQPLHGFGYYLNLGIELNNWDIILNYGGYTPVQIGMPQHDVTTRRGFGKLIYHFSPNLEMYSMLMLENDVPNAQAGRNRKGSYILAGFQFTL